MNVSRRDLFRVYVQIIGFYSTLLISRSFLVKYSMKQAVEEKEEEKVPEAAIIDILSTLQSKWVEYGGLPLKQLLG